MSGGLDWSPWDLTLGPAGSPLSFSLSLTHRRSPYTNVPRTQIHVHASLYPHTERVSFAVGTFSLPAMSASVQIRARALVRVYTGICQVPIINWLHLNGEGRGCSASITITRLKVSLLVAEGKLIRFQSTCASKLCLKVGTIAERRLFLKS